jgi:hypothetical protein
MEILEFVSRPRPDARRPDGSLETESGANGRQEEGTATDGTSPQASQAAVQKKKPASGRKKLEKRLHNSFSGTIYG